MRIACLKHHDDSRKESDGGFSRRQELMIGQPSNRHTKERAERVIKETTAPGCG